MTVIVRDHFAVFFSHKVLLTDPPQHPFPGKIYQTRSKLETQIHFILFSLFLGWDSSHQSQHCPSGFSPLKRLLDKSSLRKCDRKGDDSTGTARQYQQKKLQYEFHFTAK